jgi:predicted dehydrogenase
MKIAIIGLGIMGKNHYRVLQNIVGVEIVGLCDPVTEDTFNHALYRDIDEMLNSVELDAVLIAVPTFLHKEVALKCIDKGLDIFIEKPVAPTVEEGEAILSAANAKGVKVAVGYVERFNPVVKALKDELQGKEIYTIAMTRVGPIPPRIADVGILTDLAVHDIDLIRFVSGEEITDVSIFKSQKIHNHHEDNAILSFQLTGDKIASITTSWLTPYKKRMMEVTAKEALFDADLMSQDLKEYSAFEATNTFNAFSTRSCIVRKEEPLVNELRAFVEYVKTGEIGDLATIEDSITTIRISGGAF